MARPKKDFQVILKVKYVPLPADRVAAWRAAMLLLLDLMREKKRKILENDTKDIKEPSSPAEG